MTTLHPDAERLLSIIRVAGRPAVETLNPVEARAMYSAGRSALQLPPDDVASVRDLTIDGPAGAVAARLYRGIGTAAGASLPGLLYLHGGGWVIGDLDSHDGVCRRLANLAQCSVLAVDYRMAPEHPFPAAVDDSVAALAWMVANARELGVDAGKLAVGGDSAGANLAAVLALMGRDGTLPATRCQILFYPVTDLRMNTASYAQAVSGVPLTASTMRWFIDHYAPDPASRTDWRASPLLAASLAGTPPAFVLTVGHDPLSDEGRAYAARLEQDGVRVVALHLSDQIHGLLTMNRWIAGGDAVLQAAAACLHDAWRLT